MQAETVVALYTLLLEHGVQIWIDGGWGIDALFQHQTRPHKDLDALVQLEDLAKFTAFCAARDFCVTTIWNENRWTATGEEIPLVSRVTALGTEVATAFVLRNSAGHELDIHVLQFDVDGYGIAAWHSDFNYPPDAFEGRGTIGDMPVCCLSAQMQMTAHTGYELQDKDRQDMRTLHERFGVDYPADNPNYSAGPGDET